jgi:gliding motility-associated-like protein
MKLNSLFAHWTARSFAVLLACSLTSLLHGQVIHNIADGDLTACDGAIVDSGGEGGPGYGNNESHTATICPGIPGEGISLNFIMFNLSTAGPAPLDQLTVFDGDNTGAPVIGTYTGTELQGQIVFASATNPTGCLTLFFTSNANGTGTFAASITCYTPCIPPDAVAQMSEPAPALVCVGEDVTFDCSASTAAPGFNIVSRVWDFNDGSTADGTVVQHIFSEPGDYLVQLTLTDDNGCTNTNLVDLLVLVGTTPLFNGTTPSLTVCEGATVDLTGIVTPVMWTGIPEVDFGDGVYLPDNVGSTFTSQVSNTYFSPGATLTNVNDLLSICVDMEHSFMGDLVINLTCPNGQSVVLHQQGGGGTYLGGANDGDDVNPDPGTCWNYCWAPNAPNGTWVQSVGAGLTMPSGTGGNALQPGTYSSVGSMNNLIGCPLNGTWTIAFTDLWGIDNGFLCSWNMDFSPALYPDLVQFTPVPGYSTTDSMFWSGPNVVINPADPLTGTVTVNDPGTFDYTFNVTDNFGCVYDTTITITVTNAPVVEATMTLGAGCSDPAQLDAEIVAFPPPPPPCNYTLTLYDSFGDGWNGGANVQVVINGVATSYALPPGGNSASYPISVQTGATIALVFTAGNIWNNENSLALFSYTGATLYTSPAGPPSSTLWNGTGDCGPNSGPVVYAWTPAAGVVSPSSASTLTQITQPTEFVITVHPPGQPWCNTTDTVLVAPPSFLESDSVVTNVLCNGGDGSIEIINTGLGGPWNYLWTDDQGNTVSQVNGEFGNTLTAPAGTYTVFVSEGGPAANGCADTLTASITEPELLTWDLLPTDTTICLTGIAQLAATTTGGTGNIAIAWTPGLVGNGPHNVSPANTTTYALQATDANGCVIGGEQVTVTVLPALSYIPLQPDSECFGIPVDYYAMGVSGGDGAYQYDWGQGPQASPTATFTLPVTGTICMTLSDGCETPPLTTCAPLEILQTPPLELVADTVFGCAPFTVGFALTDTTGGAQVEWDFGHGQPLMGPANTIHVFNVAGNYTVGVEVTWPNGCVTDTSIAQMIRVISVPIASMNYSPRPATVNNSEVHFEDTSIPNAVSWYWDFDEFGTSTAQDTVIEFPNETSGIYPVLFAVANELGCSDTLRTWVEVLDEFLVWVPNTFTPNDDEHNQLFFVSGNDIATDEFELIIFDRWGKEVFNTTDRYLAWNGTDHNKGGAVLPTGIYNWRLSVRSQSTQKEKIIYGHVNLLQ